MSRSVEAIITNGRLPIKSQVRSLPSVTIAELLGKVDQGEITQGLRFFESLTQAPTWPYVVNYADGTRDYCVVAGQRVDPYEVNMMWYFAAKNKTYGFDSEDIISDAYILYSGYEQRLARRHRYIPGWDLWQREFRHITSSLEGYVHGYNPEEFGLKGKWYLPLMRWRNTRDGEKRWIYQLERGKLSRQLKHDLELDSTKRLSPLVGINLMWAMSQELVAGLPERINYDGQSPAKQVTNTQIHGVLQTPGMNVIHVGKLFEGRLLRAYEAYCDQGSK